MLCISGNSIERHVHIVPVKKLHFFMARPVSLTWFIKNKADNEYTLKVNKVFQRTQKGAASFENAICQVLSVSGCSEGVVNQ